MSDEPKIRFEDISAQVFGKYQFCTKAKDGMWYSDQDFEFGAGCGPLKKGALPSPRQNTPELTAKARRMHEEAANRAVKNALRTKGAETTGATARITWWQRLRVLFLGRL